MWLSPKARCVAAPGGLSLPFLFVGWLFGKHPCAQRCRDYRTDPALDTAVPLVSVGELWKSNGASSLDVLLC